MSIKSVLLPGCKSTTQRALICAVLGEQTLVLEGVSEADDCRELRGCLSALGAVINRQKAGHWQVVGSGKNLPIKKAELNCGTGATTLRFMLAICAMQRGLFRFKVTASLLSRPHQPLIEALQAMGATIEPLSDGWAMDSRYVKVADIELDSSVSSQFKSALLLAQGNDCKFAVIEKSTSVSGSYFELTKSVISDFSQSICSYTVPGDLSASLYFAAYSIINECSVSLENAISLGHPEIYALEFLHHHFAFDYSDKQFIARANASAVAGPLIFDVARAVDASLVIAVLARVCEVEIKFINDQALSHKESDRKQAIVDLQTASEVIDCRDDHRIAMAAAVLQLHLPELQIIGHECVSKSFPDFFNQWSRLND